LEAAILSRIRSEVTSRSNWAKGQQDVQDQPPHRGRRIELLGAQSSADPKRPFLWGPAAAGEAGVDSPIRILREELDTAMVLLGARCLADIPADLLRAERC